MKSVLAIRHVHFEDLGLLGDVLAERGWQITYHDAASGPLDAAAADAADLLVILGGPIGVYEDDIYPFLSGEIAAAQRRLTAGKPTIGICLGAQIMARALGQKVYPSGVKEIGWGELTLSDAGQTSVLAPLAGHPVLHWHGDTFDLPANAVLLASTAPVPHQAFAIGAHALALQFHLEAKPEALEQWYVGHACEIAVTQGVDVPMLRRQAERHAAALQAPARQVFSTWLDGLHKVS